MTSLGADYPLEKFMRTPITELNYVIEQVVNEEQRLANVAARPIATLTVIVQYCARMAVGHSDSTEIDPKKYLPYPTWQPIEVLRKNRTKHSTQIRDKTKQVLVTLLKTRSVPMHVYSALMRKED